MDSNEFCSLLRESKQFDDLEIRILRAMISLENRGRINLDANKIAKEAGISVTNAYKYLYSIEKKGLVESSERKNKIFWLARTTNPFPRLFSKISRYYLQTKELFSKLEEMYEEFTKDTKYVWHGEKLSEQYQGNFADRAAFLFDIARDEILLTTKKFYDDIVLLDAIKRAIQRNIKIRIIADEIHPDVLNKLRKINIDMRLGRAWPYLIVVDGKHGMTVDENEKGIWFLNCKTDYRDKFEEFWERAHAI